MSAWGHRVHGLAAETGFWALLSLAPLLLGVLAVVGYLAPIFGQDVIAQVEEQVVRGLSGFLTEDTLQSLIRPLVEGVLSRGRAGVASAGFAVAVWSGSTALGALINAIAIAYGQRGVRGPVRTRLTALALYVGALVVGALFLPLLVVGPRILANLVPADDRDLVPTLLHWAYWPAVALGALAIVMVFYHVGMPRRAPWREHLPGAAFAVAIWLAGSFALREFLRFAFGSLSTYGPLTTPIAALLFFYVSSLAVLLGAELNAQRSSFEAARPDSRPRAGRGRGPAPEGAAGSEETGLEETGPAETTSGKTRPLVSRARGSLPARRASRRLRKNAS